MKANPNIIKMWSERDKCWQCKHRFSKPVILPVKKPVRGKLQPNYNAEVLFHMHDTHGIPADLTVEWIFNSIYGQPLKISAGE